MNCEESENNLKIIDDTINLGIRNSNKNIKVFIFFMVPLINYTVLKASIRANWAPRKIELLLTLKTTASGRHLKSSSKAMNFNLNRARQGYMYTEIYREQIGRTNTYIEVKNMNMPLPCVMSSVPG